MDEHNETTPRDDRCLHPSDLRDQLRDINAKLDFLIREIQWLPDRPGNQGALPY